MATVHRSDYYERFPLFDPAELEARLREYTFAEATLLSPWNIKGALELDADFIDVLAGFTESPFASQQQALAAVLSRCNLRQKVIDVVAHAPRHLFATTEYQELSYLNAFLPWSETAGLSPPGLVALMLQAFEPQPGKRYLEIGAGSGYHLACLYELIGRDGSAIGYEIDEDYASHGRMALMSAGYSTIGIEVGDGLRAIHANQVDGVFATAAGDGLLASPSIRKIRQGRYQWLRPLLRPEFEDQPPQSRLKRAHPSYDDYLTGDWANSFGCLSTGDVVDGVLSETDVVYEVSLVPLQRRDSLTPLSSTAPSGRRVVDVLLAALRSRKLDAE